MMQTCALLLAATLVACGGGDGGGDDDGDGTPDGSLTLPPDAAPVLPPDAAVDIAGFDDAKPVTIGDPNGEGEVLATPGDHDFFKFEATAGQWYRVRTIANAADDPMDIDTVIRVYDAPTMGAHIAENDDGVPRTSTDSEVLFRAATTGTHYVEVLEYSEWDGDPNTPAEGMPSFQFNVAVDLVDSAAGDAVIEPASDPGDVAGSAMTAKLGMFGGSMLGLFKDMADVDVYKIDVPAQVGTANLTAAAAPAGPAGYGSTAPVGRLWITDAAGTQVLARIDTARIDSLAEAAPPVVGGQSYLLWVERAAGAGGANPFAVARAVLFVESPAETEGAGGGQNDTAAGAQALTMESDGAGGARGGIVARLSTMSDVDYFSFPVMDAGHRITVSCSAARSGSGVVGLKVQVHKPNDTPVALGTTESNDADLLVQDLNPGGMGTYYLRLSKASQDPEIAGDFVRCGVFVGPP
jgi:hypothetical protein